MQESGLRVKVLAKNMNLTLMSIYMAAKAKGMGEVTEGENVAEKNFYNHAIRCSTITAWVEDQELIRK